MARRLTPDEQSGFADALQNHQALTSEAEAEVWMARLSAQRDAALILSPELAWWFGYEPPATCAD